MNANFKNIITASGPFDFHTDPDQGQYYVYFGTTAAPNTINILGLAQMTNYFEAGTKIDPIPVPAPQ